MSWIILLIAGLLEVVWAVGLKYTHGFSRLTPSIITITAMVISMALLSWAMKTLPVERRTPSGPASAPLGRQSLVSFCWASLPHRRVCSVLA